MPFHADNNCYMTNDEKTKKNLTSYFKRLKSKEHRLCPLFTLKVQTQRIRMSGVGK